MGALDLYVDGFPHGTRAGYQQGCRGGACPNKAEGLQTCKEADARMNGDWQYQKLIKAGMTELEAAAELGTARPVIRLHSEVEVEPVFDTPLLVDDRPLRPVPAPAFSAAQEAAAAAVAPPKPTPVANPAASIDPVDVDEAPKRSYSHELVHGTTSGFSKGCRDDAACPGDADGITCAEANRIYKREWAQKKADRLRAEGKIPAPRKPGTTITQLRAEVEKLREQVAKSYRWHVAYDKPEMLWVVTLRNDQRVTCGMAQWFDTQAEAFAYITDHSGAGAVRG